MANLNDYKIISQKSKKYFDLLLSDLKIEDMGGITEKGKERFGFYPFILEYLTNKKDISDLVDLITDSDFNDKIFDKKFDDLGVDAVNINDDEENIIQLFNFKYRESFKSGKQQISEAIISTKFINAIINKKTEDLQDKIKVWADEIIKKLESNEVWKLRLYIISNEDFEYKKDNNLSNLESIYGLEIISIGLNEISEFITLRPSSIDSELILDNDAVMTFSESGIVSSKSYIIRLPLSEVIRITCNNEFLRKEYNIENIALLSKVSLDFSVLFDNVRGFVTNSKFNDNILKTLGEEPNRFFIYNNGLTLTAQDIDATEVNAGKKIKILLKSIQVLNGGQTLRTIHHYNSIDAKNINTNLSQAQVSLRIFKVSSDNELNNKIAEFTNSQNAISNIDLKSLRSEQLQLEQYLSEHKIVYVRKSGDTGLEENINYKRRISMEKFGQILFSLKGYPEKATNQKKSIFDKYYNDIFGESELRIEDSSNQIEEYFKVKEEYENVTKGTNDQKIFYILYLNKNVQKIKLSDLINQFEEAIKEYVPPKDDISDARKLIQKSFKDFVDKKFGIKIN